MLELPDLLTGMNPPQREAVQHPGGPLLILAGAGSGKTRVLTHRIGWLLATRRAKPHQVLAITFTNKAAEEMRERVGALTGQTGRGLWVMTFHAACARILRRDGHALGYFSNFTIYDTSDSRRVIKRLLGAGEREDADQPEGGVRGVQAVISAAKNQLLTPDLWLESQRGYTLDERMAPQVQATYDVWCSYQEELRRANALDFDDLLVATHRLLAEHHEVREQYRHRFTHALVDEYQDTNQVQYQLLKLLVGPERNLTAVGDADQSIYAFRQADIRNILNFETDFPDATVIKLEQNYRSTQMILNAANAVIANNTQRGAKTLWTEQDGGELVQVHEVATSDGEPALAVDIIREHQVAGGALRDVAVLYRTNSQSQPFEEALAGEGIAYQMAGGMRFYERAEVKDALAYLRLLSNPADDEALARIINVPRRNLGDAALNSIRVMAAESGAALLDAARAVAGTLGSARGTNLLAFIELVDDLLAYTQERPGVAQLLDRLYQRTGLLPDESLDDERVNGRRDNLLQLLTVAATYDTKHPDGGTLTAFLETMSLAGDTDTLEDERDEVTLMTLHASKGLEYPIVILVGMEERLFPHERAMRESADAIEEERRLCYVGITRAQAQLHITHSRQRLLYGKVLSAEPSRFLLEIPQTVYETHSHGLRQENLVKQFTPETVPAVLTAPSPSVVPPLVESPQPAVAVVQPAALPAAVAAVDDVYSPSAGDRVTHPTLGVATIRDAEGQLATVIFDDEPGKEYEMHARLARLQPVG
jgi:DNA helicase-2/ATP-dependent DNA helicase PcrA